MSSPREDETEDTDGWPDIARDACRFGVDAAWVVGLRLSCLARGGKTAQRELALMVVEKWVGHATYARALARGHLGRSPRSITAATIAYYGHWVRDNRKRLAEEA